MKIGIISDSHDNMPKIREAVKLFNERGMELVIHAGDFIAPFTIDPLNELNCQYFGVFGNNDGEKFGLSKKSQGRITQPPNLVEFGGKKILVMHEPNELIALTKSQFYDIVVYGHTHDPLVEKHKKTLVINPGECCGWVNGRSTIVVADLDKMEAEIIELL